MQDICFLMDKNFLRNYSIVEVDDRWKILRLWIFAGLEENLTIDDTFLGTCSLVMLLKLKDSLDILWFIIVANIIFLIYRILSKNELKFATICNDPAIPFLNTAWSIFCKIQNITIHLLCDIFKCNVQNI